MTQSPISRTIVAATMMLGTTAVALVWALACLKFLAAAIMIGAVAFNADPSVAIRL